MLLKGSAKQQDRVMTITGLIVVVCLAMGAYIAAVNPFSRQSDDHFSIEITVPFLGQGVKAGTAIVLHGVKVGQVANVTNTADGEVRVGADLDKKPLRGLTTAMDIDYRPVNYFGVPGINLLPNPGGQELRDGSSITLVPKGNSTLSELLSQLGNVSAASLTPRLIAVIDRVTRYTDGLNPLLETAVTVTRAFADVQTVPTEQLLANTSSIAAATPQFTDAAVEALTRFTNWSYYPGQSFPAASTTTPKLRYPYVEDVRVPNLQDETEEYFQSTNLAFFQIASDGLFAAVGKVLFSHVDDLYPLITGIKAITDTTPPLLRPQDIAQKLAELRSRFERLYEGNGDQRAIRVRVLLDSLPGVAAPLGIALGGPQ